jgi:small-conductance mechanosensitive channel
MRDLLGWSWQGNTVTQWLRALAFFAVAALVVWVVRWLVTRRLATIAARTSTWLDDLLVDVVRRTKMWFIVVVALSIASPEIVLRPAAATILNGVLIVGAMLQLAIWLNGAIKFSVAHYRQSRGGDGTSVATVQGFAFLARLVLAAVLLVATLDLLGFKVTTFVAGLGITGIAIALAVQNVLGDVFAALSIVLDKPFVIGDAITVDNIEGTVEHVGLKTTRIRSSGGEQVIVANADLLKSRIRNFRRLAERRVVLAFNVQHDTDPAIAARIPGFLQEIVERQKPVRVDRSHLKSIGSWSLEYEVVYFVMTPDYLTHMNIQQAIHLAVLERFRAEGVGIATAFRMPGVR